MGVVTIHVFSDVAQGKNTAQDYHCEIKLLLKHMQYFKPFLQGLAPGQDTEIAVQCNLTTFGWLMAYVKASVTGVQPALDCSNCVPILVACSYLKMTQLIREAVRFIAANILRLAAAGVDIGGLDSALITNVAKATSEEALEALLQRCEAVQLPRLPTPGTAGYGQQALAETAAGAKSSGGCSNALLQKLYKHKLEALLKQHNTTLLRCRACQQLFSAASHKKLQCPVQAGGSTQRLQMLPLHQPDPAWRFQDFLKQQRQQSQPQQQQHCMQQTTPLHSRPLPQPQHQLLPTAASPTPWRELYYLTWSHVMVLYCTACHQHFPARQYSHCSYHPLAPVFASEAGAGQYPCCGRPAWRPGLALAHSQGCCAAQHQAALQLQQPPRRQQQQQQDAPQEGQQDASVRALQLLQRLGGVVMEPYVPPPLPPQQPDAASASAASAAAGAGHSSNGVGCTSSSGSSSSSRPDSSGAGRLPLLVRMTNRSSPRAALDADGAGDSSDGRHHVGAPPCGYQDEAPAGSAGCSRPGTAAAAAGFAEHARLARNRLTTGYSTHGTASTGVPAAAAGSSGSSDAGADALDEASTALDYRSAHLRSFMEAVHAAAECRDRGSSMMVLAGSSLSGRVRGNLGVTPGSTLSPAAVAGRLLSMPSMARAADPLHGASAAPAAASGRHQAPLVPSRGGRADSCTHQSSDSSHRPGTGPAAAAAAGVHASTVNRTLLLELMHEDDVYRMGLLMRKLDAARLQPPPDGACSSSSSSSVPGMLSEVEVAQASNSMLFTGLAGIAGGRHAGPWRGQRGS